MESIGEVIDKLIVANVKIYHLVDIVENIKSTDEEVAKAARKIQKVNRLRSQLKNQVDELIGDKNIIQEVKM